MYLQIGWNRSTHFFALFALLCWNFFCPWTCSKSSHWCWDQAMVNSYCPESFVTGSGSWSSSLCRNTYFNQTSGYRPLLLLLCRPFAEHGRGGKRSCLRRACISLPRAQKPQPPHFWAYPWPLGKFRSQLPSWMMADSWGQTKSASQFVPSLPCFSISGQLPSPDIPG